MIKAICIDLDGTLFKRRNVITEESKQAIKEAYNKGIKIVIATGRLYNNAAQVAEVIGVNCPIISANGAVVIDRKSNKEIYYSSIDETVCFDMIKLINKYKLTVHFYTKEAVISNNLKGFFIALGYKIRNRNRRYNIIIEKCISYKGLVKQFKKHNNKICKCVIYSTNENNIQAFYEEAKKIDSITVCGAGKFSAEITAKDVSKGHAMIKLAKYLDISTKEFLCIGDNENDITMIKNAGVGVAMGNAVASLKEVADYVTSTNDKDGVSEAILKFAL